MPLVGMVNEDDDNHSLSSSTNSDDDIEELNYNTHRSCSRYAPCNGKKHQHSSIDSISLISLSNNSKLVKGEIRPVNNEPGHRQKYDGSKWRRICSHPDCLIYLNGGVYYENWLCRKHYLLCISTDTSTASDNSITNDTETTISANEASRQSFTRQSIKEIKPHKRGDIMIDANGISQKYTGKVWRPVCKYDNCKSFVVAHDYCHRHDMEIRKKKAESLPSLDDIQQQNSISESQITRSIPSTIKKPKKGDIQSVRQRWNGTKWYSLCHYSTQDCTRRSGGIKCAHLCDMHYKEYIEKQNNRNLLSSTVKRQKLIHNDNIPFSNNIDKQNPIASKTNFDQIKQTEQCIQTDITYPIESNDLRQGCFLIEDDIDDQYQSESSQLMVYIKKEEENYLSNKRKLGMDVNSLSINCKLEITKLEF